MKLTDFVTELASSLQRSPLGIEKEGDYVNAAVIVPLVNDAAGRPALLFEVRAISLKRQPGEICFPGGRIETSDENPAAAAVRETSEELGIGQRCISVLGQLKPVVSPIGVLIYPFVAQVSLEHSMRLSQTEVDHVFTVPLAFLLASTPRVGHVETGSRPLPDFPLDLVPAGSYPADFRPRSTYPVYFYQYRDYVIWGITARILRSFLQAVPPECRLQLTDRQLAAEEAG